MNALARNACDVDDRAIAALQRARLCARRTATVHSRCGVPAGLPVQLTVVLLAFGTNEYTRAPAVPQWYTGSHPCEYPMRSYLETQPMTSIQYGTTVSMHTGGLRFLGWSAAHMSSHSSYTLADTDQYALLLWVRVRVS